MSTDPVDLAGLAGSGGVVWSTSPDGFHANLVVLAAGESIEAHRNDAVDVLVVGIAGSGTLTVDGEDTELRAAVAVLVPRGATRAVAAGDGELRYLTIHERRGPLTIGPRRSGDV